MEKRQEVIVKQKELAKERARANYRKKEDRNKNKNSIKTDKRQK